MILQNFMSHRLAGGGSVCTLDINLPSLIKAENFLENDYAEEVYPPASEDVQIKIEADEYIWWTPAGPLTLARPIPSPFKEAEESSITRHFISSAPAAPIAQQFVDQPKPRLFAKLPTELKIMIFELARPDPRVIKPLFSKKDGKSLYSAAKVPTLLHVCSLSRAIAKKWYSLGLPTIFTKGKTYFDLERDYLYLCDPGGCSCPDKKCSGDTIDLEFTDRVQKIAMELPTARAQPYWWYIEFMHKNVKEIMLVNSERGLIGDVAGIENFEEVDEEKNGNVLGKSKYLDARDVEREKQKSKGDVSILNWTIEHAWRANFVNAAL